MTSPQEPKEDPGGRRRDARVLALASVSASPGSLHTSPGGAPLVSSVSPLAPRTASGTEWVLNKYPLNVAHLNSTNIY